jgi:hypothetical protein
VGEGGRGWERVGEGGRGWERVGEGGRGWERVGEGGRWDMVGYGRNFSDLGGSSTFRERIASASSV